MDSLEISSGILCWRHFLRPKRLSEQATRANKRSNGYIPPTARRHHDPFRCSHWSCLVSHRHQPTVVTLLVWMFNGLISRTWFQGATDSGAMIQFASRKSGSQRYACCGWPYAIIMSNNVLFEDIISWDIWFYNFWNRKPCNPSHGTGTSFKDLKPSFDNAKVVFWDAGRGMRHAGLRLAPILFLAATQTRHRYSDIRYYHLSGSLCLQVSSSF